MTPGIGGRIGPDFGTRLLAAGLYGNSGFGGRLAIPRLPLATGTGRPR
jgi:hypothetical protein